METKRSWSFPPMGRLGPHAEYRPYLPATCRADFDELCQLFAMYGYRSCDPESLPGRLDLNTVEQWVCDFHETGGRVCTSNWGVLP